MRAGPSSLLNACPNKLGGVYSRPAPGRVSGGDRAAVCQIFSGGAAIGRAIVGPFGGTMGVKVGREKSADAAQTQGFPSFSALDRLMGRWAGPFSASGRGHPGAPLGAAPTSGHPVAQSEPEIWKISARSAALNLFLLDALAPKKNLAANGSGWGLQTRIFNGRRVGVRLISAGKASVASNFGLSGRGLECATLCGGVVHVN